MLFYSFYFIYFYLNFKSQSDRWEYSLEKLNLINILSRKRREEASLMEVIPELRPGL